MEYTPDQRRAIDTVDHNSQIIACAGSGKTSVVTARVINILNRCPDVHPDGIIAFTFTVKAAEELRDRITREYQSAFGHTNGLAGMYIGTIHGFCLDLLQRYVPKYLKYDLLDEVSQAVLVNRWYEASGMKAAGAKRFEATRIYVQALNTLRNDRVDEAVLQGTPIARALGRYQRLLDRTYHLDYDELLVRAVAELEGNELVRAAIRARVRHVLVDEYQDVNPIQEALIAALSSLGATVCVVGDDDQHIYHWRGTDVGQMLTFAERYPDVERATLSVNFRSTDAVVGVARRMAERNAQRLPKAMASADGHPGAAGDLACLTFDSPQTEAKWIADRILAMRGIPHTKAGRRRGLTWSDFAVLLRSVRHESGPVIAALRRAGVPYVVAGQGGLFDTQEVHAAPSLFWYLLGRTSRSDLAKLWRSAELGISDDGLDAGFSLLDSRRELPLGQWSPELGLQRVYTDFLEAVRLREDAVPGGRGEAAYYRLGAFSRVLTDFEATCFRGLPNESYDAFAGFLQHDARTFYTAGGEEDLYLARDAVLVTTLHQAKGLEFPVVFLPCQRSSSFVEQARPSEVWELVPRTAIRDPSRYDSSVEAERRLYYVGATRSERYLYASWSPIGRSGTGSRPSIIWSELAQDPAFSTSPDLQTTAERIPPEARAPAEGVAISFTALKHYLACPYQFKLRALCGFDAPINAAIGYGRSLHNVLADLHRQILAGHDVTDRLVGELFDLHWSTPYATQETRQRLRASARRDLDQYVVDRREQLAEIGAVEQPIEVTIPDSLRVSGRIDLVRRGPADRVTIVDFKSVEEAQPTELTRHQLLTYALGYEQLCGRWAVALEAYNLDDGVSVVMAGDEGAADGEAALLRAAGDDIAAHRLRACPLDGCCHRCDTRGICGHRDSAPDASV